MRVIIADDSAVVRAILEQNLKKVYDGKIEIVSSVSSGQKLCDAAESSDADIILCDTDMPGMNGIEACRKITSQCDTPVILLSEKAEDKTDAVKSGAVEFVFKPGTKDYNTAFFTSLKALIDKNVKKKSSPHASVSGSSPKKGQYKLLCIGASTGGPTAVVSVLNGLGKNFPIPVIYSQHIDLGADKKMAQWLDESCPDIHVKLAEDREEAVPGTVYMAPSDRHLVLDCIKSGGGPVIHISDDPPEHFLRPCVNVMFKSAAKLYGSKCLTVLLTGMGRDGAEGCRKTLERGGWTICEDKSTCVVFGMPAAAIEEGGAGEVLPRNEIPRRVLELVNGSMGEVR